MAARIAFWNALETNECEATELQTVGGATSKLVSRAIGYRETAMELHTTTQKITFWNIANRPEHTL